MARAQLSMGHGRDEYFQDLSTMLSDEGEDPQGADIRLLEQVIHQLSFKMEQILLHARTRLTDDGGLYHYV